LGIQPEDAGRRYAGIALKSPMNCKGHNWRWIYEKKVAQPIIDGNTLQDDSDLEDLSHLYDIFS
jgi:hypothetical protein